MNYDKTLPLKAFSTGLFFTFNFFFFSTFFSLIQLNNNESPMGMAVGMPDVKGSPAAVDLAKNPLAETHEFKQACSLCYVKTGEELLFTVV